MKTKRNPLIELRSPIVLKKKRSTKKKNPVEIKISDIYTLDGKEVDIFFDRSFHMRIRGIFKVLKGYVLPVNYYEFEILFDDGRIIFAKKEIKSIKYLGSIPEITLK